LHAGQEMKEYPIDPSMVHPEVSLHKFCRELNLLLERSDIQIRFRPEACAADHEQSPQDRVPDDLWTEALQRSACRHTIPGLGTLTTDSPRSLDGVPVLRAQGKDLAKNDAYPGRPETAGDVVGRSIDAGQVPCHALRMARRFLEEDSANG